MLTLPEDFADKLETNGWHCEDGSQCWLWMGVQSEGTLIRARRFVWRATGQFRLGSTETIRAACVVDRCMNPAHLERTCAIIARERTPGSPRLLREQPPDVIALSKEDAAHWRRRHGVLSTSWARR